MRKVFWMWLVALSLAAAPAAATYQAKDFTHLVGMEGFTKNALETHFKLYQGYVKNTNLLIEILQGYRDDGKTRTPQYAEIERRFGWEFDGMRLHELYFENLGGKGAPDEESALYKEITKQFGSFEKWKTNFMETGMMRGIGWIILYRDPETGRLFNMWINEHDHGHMAGGTPLLIMDVWEHAYLLDYGLDRMGYIEAFFKNINWSAVQKRFP